MTDNINSKSSTRRAIGPYIDKSVLRAPTSFGIRPVSGTKPFVGYKAVIPQHNVLFCVSIKKGWDNSEHPFDQRFNQELMSTYDVENVEAMEEPRKLVDFRV